ncbi:MAG: galactokinase family protein [Planctomycetota bacterium]
MGLARYRIKAPGRICLFGEHQDYLGLPVIAAAIGLELRLDVVLEDPGLARYRIIMPDVDKEEVIRLAEPLIYRHDKDYLRSAMKVLRDAGVELPGALTATIRSEIPIASGTSSSSALINAWIAALLHGAGHRDALDPLAIARFAHRAEVVEFNESGGMMDHLSIAFGGICLFDFAKTDPLTRLPATPHGWVLGDSRQPKQTQAVLSRVRRGSEEAIRKAASLLPGFDLRITSLEEARRCDLSAFSEKERDMLSGQLRNRDLLMEGLTLLSGEACPPERLGRLLSKHHKILRDTMEISTPKIEAMLAAALDAGALGGKINGSGGGGCLFVLAPGREREVAKAMEMAGGKAWPVEIGAGIRIH